MNGNGAFSKRTKEKMVNIICNHMQSKNTTSWPPVELRIRPDSGQFWLSLVKTWKDQVSHISSRAKLQAVKSLWTIRSMQTKPCYRPNMVPMTNSIIFCQRKYNPNVKGVETQASSKAVVLFGFAQDIAPLSPGSPLRSQQKPTKWRSKAFIQSSEEKI